jgi:hypothetical protein
VTKTPFDGQGVENFIQGEIFADTFPLVPISTSQKNPRKSLKKERDELISRLPEFRVIRSSRRKRSISAFRQNGAIEIHIPDRLTRREEFEIIPEMIELVLKRENRLRKSDSLLKDLCEELISELLPEFYERPTSVTWRSMRERWGSCTTIDRTIRISDRLMSAPNYALNYVLFHELIHLRVAGHDDDFYELLNRYPEKVKADAFLEGYESGAAGHSSDLLDLERN